MSSRRRQTTRVLTHGKLRLLKTTGLVFLLGFVLLWMAVMLIPTMTRVGISTRTANRIPLVALFLGLACGASVRGRELLMSLLSPLLAGAVFWFFGVVSGGLFVTFGGVDEETADYIPLVAFWFGGALVALPALAVLHDRFVNARGRLRKRGDGAATDIRPREP